MAMSLSAGGDWGTLTPEGKRAIISAAVKQATVKPGRGTDRVSVELVR